MTVQVLFIISLEEILPHTSRMMNRKDNATCYVIMTPFHCNHNIC